MDTIIETTAVEEAPQSKGVIPSIQATIPVYIRFGEIPEGEVSKIHRGDAIIGEEPGVSVYRAVIADDMYYPMMEPHFTESGIGDYTYYLMNIKSYNPIYLVTGVEVGIGSDGEPLLKNVAIIQDITKDLHYIASMG